ncbi:tumor protein D53 [Cheilinus undulatus]|uniref:tumor protein D53 n=1 Tax=Cheilinus undulatus TaxID=241271 RepID=UPI001BD59D5A|nr:tumor protein D53 [Cheilinus undulatus]
METRQQELYSSVLGETVLDWGSGEEWVNSSTHEREHDSDKKKSNGEDLAAVAQNGTNVAGCSKTLPGDDPRGQTSKSQSDSCVMSTTWDMQLDRRERGRLRAGYRDSEPLREADEDLVSEVNLNNTIMTEEERQEIQQELTKLEEEISTLKQVLSSKEKQHADLKQKLGLNPLSELKNNFSRGWHDMQSSTAYKKTSETLSTAGQKTSAAFSTLGCAITKKFGDMSYSIRHSMSMPAMRNSPSFKSFEEKVESTVSTIKTKVSGPETGGSFEDVLSSAANASSQDTPSSPTTDSTEKTC